MAHPRETTRSTREDVIIVDSAKQNVKLKFELRNRSRTLSNHYDCLPLLTVRASLVVENLGLARRMTSWILSEKLIVATRLITVGNRWILHDRYAETGQWKTDTCTASVARKASSIIFIKCHILPNSRRHNVNVRGELRELRVLKPRETRKYIDQASWCKYRGISTRQEFLRCKAENIVQLQQSEKT